MANTFKFGNGQWATQEGLALAYNDENDNYKPLPFDFTRASSATRVNKQGLLETVASGLPRIDYLNNTNGALLLEPSRTNLIEYSNFSSGWSLLSGGSFAYNQTVSPDGTQNASVLSGDGVNANAVYSALNLSVQSYTLSVFAKQKGVSIISFEGFTSGALGLSKFNLSNGTIETASSNQFSDEKIEDYGNGWYRCSVKLTPTSSSSKFFGFKGGDSDSGELFSLYGAQLEVGSYPTSYIPTSGSAVTRLVESCSQTTPSGVIGQTEGTLYAEYYFDATIDNSGGSDRDIVSISANSSNIIKIVHYGNGSSSYSRKIYLYSFVGSSDVVTISSPTQSSGLMKVAAAYKNNDYVLYVNGVQIGTDTSASVPTCSVFVLGKYTTAIVTPTPINETKLYNTRLSNAELQALTS